MSLSVNPKRLERELKRLRYELEVAQQQTPYLRALVEGTQDRLALLDQSGIILEYNRAFMDQFVDHLDMVIYGRSISTIFRQQSDLNNDIHHPLITDQLLAKLQKSKRLYGCIGNDDVEVDLNPLTIQGQHLVVVSARPLTEEGKREREIQTMRLKLNQLKEQISADREQEKTERLNSLSLLAGSLAHDLNNALAVVLGNLELLNSHTQDDYTLDILDDIRLGVHSAQNLSERLKTFSKGNSSALKPIRFITWLEQLIRALSKANNHRIHIATTNIDSMVRADESQLSQLFINLITNAFQSMNEAGEISAKVEIKLQIKKGKQLKHLMFSGDFPCKDDLEYQIIEILDRGTGIPKENLLKIFDPFFSTKDAGSGIGLASCQKIAYAHRGGIVARNRKDGGANFTIALPICTECDQISAQASPVPTKLNIEKLKRLTVVVLDDEPVVRQTIKKILQRAGVEVFEAESCEEVLSLHQSILDKQLTTRSSLIYLLDLNIEGKLSGVETLRRLNRIDPSVMAVACSGYYKVKIPELYSESGFKGYVSKPFTEMELISALLDLI